MGLDAYAFIVDNETRKEFCYWRSNRELQNWMRDLYCAKERKVEQFNQEEVEIDSEDLNRLKEYLESFYQEEFKVKYSDEEVYFKEELKYKHERDMRFLKEAQEALESGNKIVYSSSW